MKTIYRYEVPIDDQPHTFELTGFPLRVEANSRGEGLSGDWYAEFWAEHKPEGRRFEMTFQVYGTGHDVPDHAIYHGTTQRRNGLVFHLYELNAKF